MAKKASHGWSNRQQGGFRPAGPGRHIYSADPPLTQSLSLGEAAKKGALISSHCQKCGKKNLVPVYTFLKANPTKTDKSLNQINGSCKDETCQGKIVILSYTLNKQSAKQAKTPTRRRTTPPEKSKKNPSDPSTDFPWPKT